MKAKERMEMVDGAKRYSTKKLHEIVSVIKEIEMLRDKKKGSYFWTPDDTASGRRSYEKYWSREIGFIAGGYTVHYKSHVECSCRHIYWGDELTCKNQSGEEVKINVGDLQKIRDSLQTRIEERKARV